jgi:hypothetical protein
VYFSAACDDFLRNAADGKYMEQIVRIEMPGSTSPLMDHAVLCPSVLCGLL